MFYYYKAYRKYLSPFYFFRQTFAPPANRTLSGPIFFEIQMYVVRNQIIYIPILYEYWGATTHLI